MSDPLIPVRQLEIEFYDTLLYAIEDQDGNILVPVRPICEGLGVNWSAQFRKIKRDEVLNEVIGVASAATPGGHQEMITLPLKFIPGWLFGINAGRVKPELKENILRYRREVYDVISEAFEEGRLSPVARGVAMSPARQALQMLEAMTELARNQVRLEEGLANHDQRIEALEEVVNVNLTQRFELVEEQLSLGEYITEGQASQISQAVKAVAMKLGEQSGRNEYGGVYGELYRKFSITSYKSLPAGKFQKAMDWLNEWYQALVDDVEF